MRIALISEFYPENQDLIGSVAYHIAEQLESSGHSALLLKPQGIPILLGRTKVVGIDNPWEDIETKTSLFHTLKQFQPDLLHVVEPRELGFKAMHFSQDSGTPIVASFHSEYLDLARLWGFEMTGDLMWSFFRGLHDVNDLTLVPSYMSKMVLKDLGFERVETWSRGVDSDLFSPSRRSDGWRIHLTEGEPNRTILLFAGRLSSEKHVELLLPIIKANPECRLAIVGDGPYLRWLRDYFDGTPTIFTGRLDQGDLAEVYASADIFVHPASNRISPVTTLEAMASGLPVLAPHSGTIVDFAVHGENSLLFLPGDTEQAVNFVAELAGKPNLRTDLGRIARQTALERNWRNSCDKLIATYAKILADRPSPVFLPIPDFQALPVP